MVLRTIFGAVIGAVFGYIVGWVLEHFPNFNAALLDGLHAITGIGGIRTAALLAAVGFIGGIISGLLSEAAHKKHWW